MYINRGVNPSFSAFTGQMDNLQIYKKVLTVAEIDILYNDNELSFPLILTFISNPYKSINYGCKLNIIFNHF